MTMKRALRLNFVRRAELGSVMGRRSPRLGALARCVPLAILLSPLACNTDSTETLGSSSLADTVGNITISGQVKTAGGVGIPNVTVTLAGTKRIALTTGSNGTYSFTQLPPGSYSVQPTSMVCSFAPTVVNLANVTSNVTQNFTGTGSA